MSITNYKLRITTIFEIGLFCCVLTSFLICFSCHSEDPKKYLFIGHGYQWGRSDKADFRLERIDYDQFDQVWLGGDICAEVTEKNTTLDYIDSLFHLSGKNRHWSLGNHDSRNGHLDWIEAKTGRPTFYTTTFDDICLMVWNTNFNHFQVSRPEDECPSMDTQFQMIQQVCDTITESKKLIVLHHHALLNDRIAGDSLHLGTVFNFYRDSFRMRCVPETWFETAVYPLLTKVRQRGIEVVMISGDLGQRAKRFEYRSKEGIWFLGAGINNTCGKDNPPDYVTNFQPDSLLVLSNQPGRPGIEWKFVALDHVAGVVFDTKQNDEIRK